MSDSAALNFIFDPVNNRCYCNTRNEFTSVKMPLFYCTSSMGAYPCARNGFYEGKLSSAADVFFRGDSRQILNRAIEKTITDTENLQGISGTDKGSLICLVPDVMDEFSSKIRGQLNYFGRSLFLIPRSVPLVYSEYLRSEGTQKSFFCLDYDGAEFSAEQMRFETVGSDKDRVIARIAQKEYEGEHPTFRTLSDYYLERYAKEHGISLSEEAKNKITQNRLLLDIFENNDKTILVQNGNKRMEIHFDLDIFNELGAVISRDISGFTSKFGNSGLVLILSSITGNTIGVKKPSDLSKCYLEIQKRLHNNKTVWLEYLPTLKLECVKDGLYDTIELIGKNEHRDISGSFIDTAKTFTKRFTIPRGERFIELPILQSVFGQDTSYKAFFDLGGMYSRNNKSDPEIDLKVTYRYGSTDKYSLSAETTEKTKRIWKGEWVSIKDDVIKNIPQSYCEPIKYTISNEDFTRILHGFEQIDTWKRDKSVYVDRNEKKLFSAFKLLNNIGYRYFPGIRDIAGNADINKRRELISCLKENDRIGILVGLRDKDRNYIDEFDEEIRSDISDNAGKICQSLSILPAADPGDYPDIEPGWFDVVNNKLLKTRDLCELTQLSAFVDPSEDRWGVWDRLRSGLLQKCQRYRGKENLLLQRYERRREINELLRSMANVCWLTENWIYGLYDFPEGSTIIRDLLKMCVYFIRSGYEYMPVSKENLNAKVMRDYLELLLSFCRLKGNPGIPDNNSQETKDLVRLLKDINLKIRTMDEEGKLNKNPNYSDQVFCSHINFDEDDEQKKMHRTYPIILSLIKVLTGQKPIALLGYSSSDNM
ncbi:MAG: hypothetical protein IJI14_14420 [Anaerolineaceae bacterium]|nr:hypothetical protein [Anaerolineaceae bacterium]